MLKAKTDLEQHLTKQCDRIATNKEAYTIVYNYANQIYNMPKGKTLDYITGRVGMAEASEFELFVLLDSIRHMLDYVELEEFRMRRLNYFYTDQEINYYSQYRFEADDIKFPMSFKMIQIAEDQWIGYIDIKTLMKLRRAQIINYNTNAQRTMQRIIRKDKELYKIHINNNAVNAIADLFIKDVFIPNTITLNMPAEIYPNFSYNPSTCTLTIKELDHFDITDGYHRFLAACKVSDVDPDFNYNMEVRIVNFTEEKAKQMIYQEDQKTKMSKIDSESMNMNKAANIAVMRINENSKFNLKGCISLNQGLINSGELAELIHYFYFKDAKQKEERIILMQVVPYLIDRFNALTEYNMNYLEEKMKYPTLLAAMYCFYKFQEENIEDKTLCELIEKISEKIINSNNPKFNNKKPRKILMTLIEQLLKEVVENDEGE